MSKLTDTDKMPWGAHEGKLMQDVPASYFHFLWTEKGYKNKKGPVADYIRENMSALQMDYPDGIW